MARIRTIKPEFWTSEQVMELSIAARLLFVGMWNFCDDRGVHPASFKTLKAEIFPSDDLLSSDVERLINELLTHGLLSEFEASDRKWWFVTGWHHQVINRPSKSRFPEPPRTTAPLPSAAGQGNDDLTGQNDDETTAFSIDSMRTHGALTEGSRTEGKGEEGKGKEENPLSEHKSVETGSSTGAPHENALGIMDRATEIAILIRDHGIDATPALLRASKFRDALTQPNDDWIAAAVSAKSAKPGERISAHYLLPKVLDMARRPPTSPSSHSRRPETRSNHHDERAHTIAVLTGRDRQGGDGRVIDVTPA